MAEVLRLERLGLELGGRELLRDVSLTVAAGEVVGLVGPSGSGKSLTALAVMGLEPEGARRSGAVWLEGRRIDALAEPALRALRGRRMGLVFQEPAAALDPVRRIGPQVAEAVRAHPGAARASARALAHAALEAAGLRPAADFARRFPHQLSGGQRQRAAIAAATVLAPALLIADEPTTALDPIAAGEVLALLRALARDTGAGVLLVSHDLAALAGVADRLAVLDRGAVVETGAAAQVLRAPVHPRARALLAAARGLAGASAPPRRPRAPAEPPALEARGLACSYPAPSAMGLPGRRDRVQALDGVSLALAPGERVGLVGLSGSGKSTLLRALLGLQPLDAGEVRVAGEPFAPAPAPAQRRLRRQVQVVLQDPHASFDPTWRVERLVAEPLALADPVPDRRARRARVEALLERLGLEAADADRAPHALSGGQRQRVALARALILEPRVLLLDEATAALDAATGGQVLALLAAEAERRPLAMLFISHNLATLRGAVDRLLVLDAGAVVEAGDTEAVLGAPRHPLTQALVAAVPRLPAVAPA